MKKLCMIFVMAVLVCILAMPVMAATDYDEETPDYEEITLEDEEVALGITEGPSIGEDEEIILEEEITLEDEEVALGIIEKPAPQTGDDILTPVILTVVSGIGLLTFVFFGLRKRIVKK